MVYERDPKTGRKCKRGQKGVWYYAICIDGVRYRSSIPAATNKKEAQVAEATARAEIFAGTYAPRRKVGRAIFADFVWIEEKQTSEYLEWAKENKKSWRADKSHAKVIAGYFKGKQFREITPKIVEAYRDYRLSVETRRKGARSKESVRREMACLSKIFQVAIENKLCAVNPVRDVKLPPKQKNPRNRTISEGEEDLILSRMTGRYARLRAPWLAALYVGCRRGEMFLLRWSDIDFDHQTITFREETTKDKETRTVSMIEPAVSELQELKNQGVTDPTIFGIGMYWATDLLGELLDELEAEGLLKPGIIGWHTCRHTYATRYARAGGSPTSLRDQLGHRELDMTVYYIHAGREDLLREARKLEKRPN